MFEELADYKNILVTGCQRSGTTIASKMIAKDLGYTFVDEADFDVYVDHVFATLLKNDRKQVIQCPAMFKLCCGIQRDDTIVVFMDRDFEDVYASEKRICWSGEGQELKRLGKDGKKSCELKWDYFKEHKPKHYTVLPYESLSDHPMWVDKKNRKHFSAKQTS